eukprot:scaffold1178_cov252-Pinguiococcus_pyrenoidosus.AAC.42
MAHLLDEEPTASHSPLALMRRRNCASRLHTIRGRAQRRSWLVSKTTAPPAYRLSKATATVLGHRKTLARAQRSAHE